MKCIPLISTYLYSADYELFTSIVNQGIDSRLEAFIKSKFIYNKETNRMEFYFHKDEYSILLRRLSEYSLDDNNAYNILLDIIYVLYGYELT